MPADEEPTIRQRLAKDLQDLFGTEPPGISDRSAIDEAQRRAETAFGRRVPYYPTLTEEQSRYIEDRLGLERSSDERDSIQVGSVVTDTKRRLVFDP